MKSHLYHVQLNIDFKYLGFYKGLLEFIGWKVIFETDKVVGYKSATNGDLWLVAADTDEESDYDAKGVNHIALRVDRLADVDKVRNYLESNGTGMLFETPKHRSEFTDGGDETYYQIMFETPDKLLFEVVYIGPK